MKALVSLKKSNAKIFVTTEEATYHEYKWSTWVSQGFVLLTKYTGVYAGYADQKQPCLPLDFHTSSVFLCIPSKMIGFFSKNITKLNIGIIMAERVYFF